MTRPGNRSMTKGEAAWVTAVKKHGCVCCTLRGYPHDPDGYVVDAHHLLSGGIRRGHWFTIGLCKWHHSGRVTFGNWNHEQHRQKLGPSLLEGSVPFINTFGDDDFLLAAQIEILKAHGQKIRRPD